MATLSKWRLSFYSSSKPKLQLRKLWQDHKQLSSSSTDETRLRSLAVFTEAVLNSVDVQQASCNIDDLIEELPIIFNSLALEASHYAPKLRPSSSTTTPPSANLASNALPSTLADEVNNVSDVIGKCLMCLELFSGSTNNFKPSSVILDQIAAKPSTLKCLIDVFDCCSKTSLLMQTCRLLKIMLTYSSNIEEGSRLNVPRRISEVIARNSDPTVVTQAISILRMFCESRQDKFESLDRQKSIGSFPLPNTDPTSSGLTMAYQLVGDLLRLAPSSWFANDQTGIADMHGRPKNFETTNLLESSIRALVNGVAIPNDQIELERDRILLQHLVSDRENTYPSEFLESPFFETPLDSPSRSLRNNSKRLDDSDRFSINDSNCRSVEEDLGVVRILLLGLTQSITPALGIEILKSIESLVIGQENISRLFIELSGCDEILKMLFRIEDNIEFLQPRMNESKAVARGEQLHATAATKINEISSQSEASNRSTGDDKYYGQVTSILVNLILESNGSTYGSPPVSGGIFSISSSMYEKICGSRVRNYSMASMLSYILLCGYPSLVSCGVKALQLLLFASSYNAVLLELCGVSEALLILLGSLITCGGLPTIVEGITGSEMYTLNDGMRVRNLHLVVTRDSHIKSLDQLTADVLNVIQTMAVAESNHNISALAFILALLLVINSEDFVLESKSRTSAASKFNPATKSFNNICKCQNCETEIATLECLKCCKDGLHDSFRLCHECDRVFHKAVAKKSHIRIALHPPSISFTVLSESGQHVDLSVESFQLLSRFFDKKARNAFSMCTALRESGSMRRSGLFKGCNGIDSIQIYALLSLRGLMDDRQSRNQHLPGIFVEPFSLLLKRYCAVDQHYDSSKPMADGLKSRNEFSKLSVLADFRDDILLSPYDISGQAFDGYENSVPPEDITNSELRICLSLILQCLARVVLLGRGCKAVYLKNFNFDEGNRPGEKRDVDSPRSPTSIDTDTILLYPKDERHLIDRIDIVSLFLQCGLDGILIMLFVSEKSSLNRDSGYISFSDRQFALWLYREVCALACESSNASVDHSSALLSWFPWLLSSHFEGVSGQLTAISPTNKRAHFQQLPLITPVLSAMSLLMILQEITVLLSALAPDKQSDEIPAFNYCSLKKIPCSVPCYPPPTRNPSFEHLSVLPPLPTSNQSTSLLMMRQAFLSPYCYSSVANTARIKNILTDNGALDFLTRFVFGDLCFPSLHRVWCVLTEKHKSDFTESLDDLSELQLEIWWSAFGLWSSFISNNEKAKSFVFENCSVSLKDILSILLALGKSASLSPQNKPFRLRQSFCQKLVFIKCQLLLDGCVDPQPQGYSMVSCRWPASTAPFSNESQNTSNSLKPNNGYERLLLPLFNRKSISYFRRTSSDIFSTSNNPSAEELLQLSPVMFIRPRTLANIVSIYSSSHLFLFDFLKEEWKKSKIQNRLPKDRLGKLNVDLPPTWSQVWSQLYQQTEISSSVRHDMDSSSHHDITSETPLGSLPVTIRRRSTSHVSNHGTVHASTYTLSAAESDVWEVESLRTLTSITGNDIKAPHQSLINLSSALFQQQNYTPTASVNGDSASTHTRIQGISTAPNFLLFRSHSKEEIDIKSKFYQGCQDTALSSPFPPVLFSEDQWRSMCFSLVLVVACTINAVDGVNMFERIVLFVHYHLLTKFGLTLDMIESEEEFNLHRPPQFSECTYGTIIDLYKLMLRKHLLVLLSPFSSQLTLSEAVSPASQSYNPNLFCRLNYSSFRLRGDVAAKEILSIFSLSTGEQREHILNFICNLAEKSEINLLALSKHSETILDLYESSLLNNSSGFQDARDSLSLLNCIIGQVISSDILRRILNRLEMTQTPSSPKKRGFQLTGERATLMHLLNLASKSNIVSEPKHSNQQSIPLSRISLSDRISSLVMWVRPRCMDNISCSSGVIAQMYKTSVTLVRQTVATIFFRTVFKSGGLSENISSESNLSTSGTSTPKSLQPSLHSTLQGIAQPLDPKSYLQLCISFNEVGTTKMNEKNYRDLSNPIVALFSDTLGKNSIECKKNTNDVEPFLCSVTSIAESLTKFSIPDIIVDYEWPSSAQDHLLCLFFRDDNLECYIDGLKRRLLNWTPLGYEYDSQYKQQQELFEDIVNQANDEDTVSTKSLSVRMDARSVARDPLMLGPYALLNSLLQTPAKLNLWFDGISNESPLIISVGGPEYEENDINILAQKIECWNAEISELVKAQESCKMGEISVFEKKLELIDRGRLVLDWLVKAFRAVQCRFSGSIKQVVVLDELLEVNEMMYFVSQGPSIDIAKYIVQSSKISGTSATVLGQYSHHECVATDTFTVRLPNSLSRSIQELGGLRIFFQFLRNDSTQSSTLRIICNIMFQNEISKQDYNAILSCLRESNVQSVTRESLLVLMDSAVFIINTQDSHQRSSDQSSRAVNVLHNKSLLSLAVDLTLAYQGRLDLYVLLLGWLANNCDDLQKNAKLTLDTMGIYPLVIMAASGLIVSPFEELVYPIAAPSNKSLPKLPISNPRFSLKKQSVNEYAMSITQRATEKHRIDGIKRDAQTEKQVYYSLKDEEINLQTLYGKLLRAMMSEAFSIKTDGSVSFRQLNHFAVFFSYALLCSRRCCKILSYLEDMSKPSEDPDANKTLFPAQRSLAILSASSKQTLESILMLWKTNILIATNIRNVFQSIEAFWFMLLELAINSNPSSRRASIELITMSMTLPNGGPDANLVSAFEKLGGFVLLSEKFLIIDEKAFVPKVTLFERDEKKITEVLTIFLFCHIDKTVDQTALRNKLPPKSDSDIAFQSKGFLDMKRQELSNQNESSLPETGVNSLTKKSKDESGQVSGIMSLFTWSSSASSFSPSSRSVLGDGFEVGQKVAESQSNSPLFSKYSLRQNSGRDSQLGPTIAACKTEVSNPPLSSAPPAFPELETNIGIISSNSELQKFGLKGGSDFSLKAIRAPQIIVVIFKQFMHFKNLESMDSSIAMLDKYISSLDLTTVDSLREIVSQGDLLSSVLDFVGKLLDRLRLIQIQNRIGSKYGSFDDSDSLSVNSLAFSDTDTDASGLESDGDTNSQHSAIAPHSSSALGHREETRTLQLLARTAKLLRSLFVQDILLQPASTRLWPELFNQSAQTEVQLFVCIDVLNNVRHYLLLSTETALLIIENMSRMLQSAFEKLEVTMEFSVKVLQAIHLLHYHCPPETRMCLQTSNLQQVRHEFVVRVIVDKGEDAYMTRVAAMTEIRASLQAYLTSGSGNSAAKIIPDSCVLLSVLGMFMDAYDDLEVIANEVHQTADQSEPLVGTPPMPHLSSTSPQNQGSKKGQSFSMDDPSLIVERIQMLLDVMHNLIATLQMCVNASSESRRLMTKLAVDVPGDQEKLISRILVDASASDFIVHPSGTRSPWDNRSATASPIQAAHAIHILDQDSGSEVAIDIQTQDSKSSPSSSTKKESITSFLDWYLATENKSMHMHFKSRIVKEAKANQKYIDKYLEKISQRKLKHQRTTADRLSKEYSKRQKVLKDAIERLRANNDSKAFGVQRDLEEYMNKLSEKLQKGKDISMESK